MSQSSAETSMPEVIGHRGAKGTAPENTLASVRAAKDLGLGWVEVDVMLSKDKVPVIHHDLTLDRCTTGKGNVSDYTWDQLQQLDAGSYFGEEFAGERIPQLRELISICREMALQINLEVKYLRGPETRDHPTAAEEAAEIENANRVCDVIEEMAVQPRELVFSSFSRAIIGVVRSRLSTFKCSYLVNSIPADWEEFVVQHQCMSLNFNHELVNREEIAACRKKLPVFSFTVNDPSRALELLSWGVSGVFSDFPHLVEAAIVQAEQTRQQSLKTDAEAPRERRFSDISIDVVPPMA